MASQLIADLWGRACAARSLTSQDWPTPATARCACTVLGTPRGRATAQPPGITWPPGSASRSPLACSRGSGPADNPGRTHGANLASDQLKLGADVDRALEAARDRAEAGVERVHSLDLLPALVGDREPVEHVDALDDQHTILRLDLANGLDVVAVR